jgi:cardiolipin synthase (CMP-forming)
VDRCPGHGGNNGALHSFQMPRWLNVPNLLTLIRLALVPFVASAIVDGRPWRALLLFAVAAVTDLLDGAAARHFHLATDAGAYLDPIADKCLLSGVFLALALAGSLPWWLVIIVFGRDLAILAGTVVIMLATGQRKFPPSVWGKISTFVQVATVLTWMSRGVAESPVLDEVSSAMLWACAVSTIWSGLHYGWRAVRGPRVDAAVRTR